MRINRFLLGALLFSPIVVHAASFASLESASCSGSLSSSLSDEASFLCSGDLSLIGGSIRSDARIAIRADGSLFLDNLSLTAPLIDLSALKGAITIGRGTSVNGSFLAGSRPITAPTMTVPGSRTLPAGDGGSLFVSPGGNISLSGSGGIVTLVSAVPEPSAALMMVVGLLALVGVGVGRIRRGSGVVSWGGV